MEPARTAAGGIKPPRLPKFLVLDATAIDGKEETDALRDFVKFDRIEFVFPEGLADVPILEECRALCDLENFDVLYDLTMQYLVGKEIVINIINDDLSRTQLGAMQVVSKHDDLRFMQCVIEFPWLVYWLCEFMAGLLAKKFPLPTKQPVSQAAKQKKKPGKTRLQTL